MAFIPQAANAQSSGPSAAPEWYVGAGAGYHRYFSLNEPHPQTQPVYLVAGFVASPKLALQVEAQYGQYSRNTMYSSAGTGQPNDTYTTETTRSTALTALARFTRTRPEKRLHFDWLLGLALVRGVLSTTIISTSASQTTRYDYVPLRRTSPHLVGGLSLRYLLGPRLAVGTEVVLNKNLTIPPFCIECFLLGRGANFGASYRFGPKG
jgi:hypothetical protein